MDNRAVSPAIGVILMVAITVVLSAAFFAVWSDRPDDIHEPRLAAKESGDSVSIIAIQNGPISWDDVTVTGCTDVPEGDVGGGDVLSGCSGRVTIVYQDSLLWEN